MAHVVGVHIAPAEFAPVESVDQVEAVAGLGLKGDRNYGNGAHQAITVVSTEELADAAAQLGHDIPLGATRRNVTVSGVRFDRTPGAKIVLGDVIVEVHRDCAPCERMEESVGKGARAALQMRAGIRGAIVLGGTIRVGDPVTLG